MAHTTSVHPVTNRLGVLIVSLAVAVQSVAGCAEMATEQKGAATGAGLGANAVANLREGAGVSYRVLGTAPKGAQLTVVGETGPEQNKWYKVKLADGREAWVASSAVGPTP